MSVNQKTIIFLLFDVCFGYELLIGISKYPINKNKSATVTKILLVFEKLDVRKCTCPHLFRTLQSKVLILAKMWLHFELER